MGQRGSGQRSADNGTRVRALAPWAQYLPLQVTVPHYCMYRVCVPTWPRRRPDSVPPPPPPPPPPPRLPPAALLPTFGLSHEDLANNNNNNNEAHDHTHDSHNHHPAYVPASGPTLGLLPADVLLHIVQLMAPPLPAVRQMSKVRALTYTCTCTQMHHAVHRTGIFQSKGCPTLRGSRVVNGPHLIAPSVRRPVRRAPAVRCSSDADCISRHLQCSNRSLLAASTTNCTPCPHPGEDIHVAQIRPSLCHTCVHRALPCSCCPPTWHQTKNVPQWLMCLT